MTENSPGGLWLQRFFEYYCDDCGCDFAYRSRRRTFSERYLLPVLLLQPVRCGECFRRDYRLVFVPVKERLSKERLSREQTSKGRPVEHLPQGQLLQQRSSQTLSKRPVDAENVGNSRNVA